MTIFCGFPLPGWARRLLPGPVQGWGAGGPQVAGEPGRRREVKARGAPQRDPAGDPRQCPVPRRGPTPGRACGCPSEGLGPRSRARPGDPRRPPRPPGSKLRGRPRGCDVAVSGSHRGPPGGVRTTSDGRSAPVLGLGGGSPPFNPFLADPRPTCQLPLRNEPGFQSLANGFGMTLGPDRRFLRREGAVQLLPTDRCGLTTFPPPGSRASVNPYICPSPSGSLTGPLCARRGWTPVTFGASAAFAGPRNRTQKLGRCSPHFASLGGLRGRWAPTHPPSRPGPARRRQVLPGGAAESGPAPPEPTPPPQPCPGTGGRGGGVRGARSTHVSEFVPLSDFREMVVSHCLSSRKLPPSERPPAAA